MTRRAPVQWVLTVCVLALVASGCGGDAGADVEARTATTRPTTSAPSTTTTAPPPSTAVPVAGLPGDDPVAAAPRPAAVRRSLTVTGRIEIPRIGLTHTTYEGIELAVIDHGPSHWPGTAMPGQAGNTVFAGHRVTHSHPFLDIDRIAVGDQVIFVNDSGRFVYEVTETLVVAATALWIADSTPGSTFTIFACHPKRSARQRYVVKGRLLPAGGAAPAAGSPPAGEQPGAAPPPPTTTTTVSPLCLLCGLFGK